MLNKTIWWQKREALILGLFLVAAYFIWFGGGFLLFLLFLFVPDVFMLGYRFGNKTGAWWYNLGHSWIIPPIFVVLGWLNGSEVLNHIAIIWAIHICFDRALGYGLKSEAGFKHTHLGDIGG